MTARRRGAKARRARRAFKSAQRKAWGSQRSHHAKKGLSSDSERGTPFKRVRIPDDVVRRQLRDGIRLARIRAGDFKR